MAGTHPNKSRIKYNRLKLLIYRFFFMGGAFFLALDLYFIFNIKYWELEILWLNFIMGCAFIVLSFGGKFKRMFTSKKSGMPDNGEVRKGECLECGACCRLPIPCIFFFGNRCLIWNRRPSQCRNFPENSGQLISYRCGYYFEKVAEE